MNHAVSKIHAKTYQAQHTLGPPNPVDVDVRILSARSLSSRSFNFDSLRAVLWPPPELEPAEEALVAPLAPVLLRLLSPKSARVLCPEP